MKTELVVIVLSIVLSIFSERQEVKQFESFDVSDALLPPADDPTGAKTVGSYAAKLSKDSAGMKWMSETFDPIDSVFCHGKPPGKEVNALAVIDEGLYISDEEDDQEKIYRNQRLRRDLSRLKNLHAYRVDYAPIDNGLCRTRFYVGGFIGEYFVGLTVKASENNF